MSAAQLSIGPGTRRSAPSREIPNPPLAIKRHRAVLRREALHTPGILTVLLQAALQIADIALRHARLLG